MKVEPHRAAPDPPRASIAQRPQSARATTGAAAPAGGFKAIARLTKAAAAVTSAAVKGPARSERRAGRR